MKKYKYVRFQERGKGGKDIEIKPYLNPAIEKSMKKIKELLRKEIAKIYAIKRRKNEGEKISGSSD